MNYFIYVLYSAPADKYYIGYSTDPWRRLEEHLENGKDKYTGKIRGWILQAVFYVSNKEDEAIRIERFIKKQKSRNLITRLVDPDFVPDGYLAQLVRVPHVRD